MAYINAQYPIDEVSIASPTPTNCTIAGNFSNELATVALNIFLYLHYITKEQKLPIALLYAIDYSI